MSSSIASSRRGRPNAARSDEYFEITGDFTAAVAEWRRSQDDDEARQEMTLRVGCVSDGCDETNVTLLPDCSIPPETKVRCGPTSVYGYTLESAGSEIDSRCVWLDGSEEQPINLCEAAWASFAQVSAARDWKPAPPPPPTYKRLPRQPGDSFLGFAVGSGAESIKLAPGGWTRRDIRIVPAVVR